jgi:mannose-6-phosphate isomerase class I
MVIALTPFECMCGFRTLAEIAEHLRAYPEFRQVVNYQGKRSLFPAHRDGC